MSAAPTTHAPASRSSAPARLFPATLAWLFLGALTLYFLFPIFWLLVSATKDTSEMGGTNGFWFADAGFLSGLWDNVDTLFTTEDGVFGRWLLNSAVYAGLGALGSTVVSAFAGYALAKFRFAGRDAVFAGILGGVLVPGTVLALPLFLLMSRLNLTDTYWAVLLPCLVNPFGVYLCRVYTAAAMPDELLEAARIDGAGEVRIFTTVASRILSPALVTVYLFSFVSIWNNFFLPLVMLTDRDLWPATLGLYGWQQQSMTMPEVTTVVITGSLVSTLPLMVVFFAMQRYWRAGLTVGSLKG
ncbi:carbohydrate ABC transporter permease [Streptomyces sp. B6B3]|uniref:carbohydrate ABC transporter permease n=1 Tax=Streptomyces sp. B6B3 TaxID=3153570 RepID=UPI00325EA2FD